MVEHIPELAGAGVTSLKIEGRAKSAYYVAVVTNAYRQALDLYEKNPEQFVLPLWVLEEMEKVSHREYCTGFFFGNEPGQVYDNGGYVRGWEVAAVCDGYESRTAVCSQRNRFFKGETLNVLEPGRVPYEIVVKELFNHDGEPAESAPTQWKPYISRWKSRWPRVRCCAGNGKRRTNFIFIRYRGLFCDAVMLSQSESERFDAPRPRRKSLWRRTEAFCGL